MCIDSYQIFSGSFSKIQLYRVSYHRHLQPQGRKENEKSHVPLDVYIGIKIHKFCHPDTNKYEPHCWYMSGNNYVRDIIYNVGERLKKHVRQLISNQRSPFTQAY